MGTVPAGTGNAIAQSIDCPDPVGSHLYHAYNSVPVCTCVSRFPSVVCSSDFSPQVASNPVFASSCNEAPRHNTITTNAPSQHHQNTIATPPHHHRSTSLQLYHVAFGSTVKCGACSKCGLETRLALTPLRLNGYPAPHCPLLKFPITLAYMCWIGVRAAQASATLCVIKGHARPMDLNTIRQEGSPLLWSHLAGGYFQSELKQQLCRFVSNCVGCVAACSSVCDQQSSFWEERVSPKAGKNQRVPTHVFNEESARLPTTPLLSCRRPSSGA
jgi:hypothetical protein